MRRKGIEVKQGKKKSDARGGRGQVKKGVHKEEKKRGCKRQEVQ